MKNGRWTPAPMKAAAVKARAVISAFLMAVLAFAPMAARADVDPVARGMAARIKPSSSANVASNYVLQALGDSLTAGNEDGTGTTYPGVFAGLTNYQVINLGVGGQTSTQIAQRVGGLAFTLTVSGNQLVSGSNSVTAINGSAIVSMTTNSAAAQPLSTAGDNNTRSLTGTLCGLHGTLTRTASGGPPSTSETYTFTPDGSPGTTACAAGSAFTNDNTAKLQTGPVIIWLGRNNYTSVSQVESDIASVVATLGHQNYLVLSILNGNFGGESIGGGNYNTIIGLNNFLSTTYGSHYVDVRAYIVSQYNPGVPQDVTDHGNDIPPSTLRFDNIHLNQAGYTKLANYVFNYVAQLRVSGQGFLTTANVGDVSKTILASPYPIGNTTPTTGQFTTLQLANNGSLFVQDTSTPPHTVTVAAPCNVGFGSDICIGGTGGNFVGAIRFNGGGTNGNGDPVGIDKGGQLWEKRGIADLGYAYSQPTTGTTVTIADANDMAILDPAGTLASLTVTLPTCAAASGGIPSFDGKIVRFESTRAITALTVSATAGSIANGAPTSMTAGQGFGYICRVSNTTWYRIY